MGLRMDFGAPERKFLAPEAGLRVTGAAGGGAGVEGYASVFGKRDQGGDTVAPGAYAASLRALSRAGRRVKMLWQHDPGQPIGIWDEVREDATGLWVRGRLLPEVARGREAAALLEAGAIDGLSIGYRTVKASADGQGGRVLTELELWEVSLVTFPMLAEARVAAKSEGGEAEGGAWRRFADLIEEARRDLAARREAR